MASVEAEGPADRAPGRDARPVDDAHGGAPGRDARPVDGVHGGGGGRSGARVACVEVPDLALQLLLRRQPGWRGLPVAVVAEERPQALVLAVSAEARAQGVGPGLRYAAALALCCELRAGTVRPDELEAGREAVLERLHGFSPGVEPCFAGPATVTAGPAAAATAGLAAALTAGQAAAAFWLEAGGLEPLYGSLERWARALAAALGRLGLHAAVAVGFTRLGTWTAVRSGRPCTVFAEPGHERAAAHGARLERLELSPALREGLEKLGVRTLGAFVRLPAAGVIRRFGPEAGCLHAWFCRELEVPLQPQPLPLPLRQGLELDAPEAASTRLLFAVKRLLHPLLDALARRGQRLAELELGLELDGGGRHAERLRPAAPTLDALLVLELVRLRLESLRLGEPVARLTLEAVSAEAEPEQLGLFDARPKRDLDAAGRALARVRAEFGEQAVVRARLREGHLPEASFVWEPLHRLGLPQPRTVELRTLVRRLRAPPQRIGQPGRRALLPGGPYVVSGGWWIREVHREYHFLGTVDGRLLWVYYDRRRRRWFLHASVE